VPNIGQEKTAAAHVSKSAKRGEVDCPRHRRIAKAANPVKTDDGEQREKMPHFLKAREVGHTRVSLSGCSLQSLPGRNATDDLLQDGYSKWGPFTSSYGQAPPASHCTSVWMERFLTSVVTALIELTPKFPRRVVLTVFRVPPPRSKVITTE
jgi:hypothetical protein